MALQLDISADTPPLARPFASLEVGDRCAEDCRLTAHGFDGFSRLSGDAAPIHIDNAHAQRLGFARAILPGFYTTARFSRLLGMFVPGALSVIHSTRFDYREPVYLDEDGATLVTYGAVVVRLVESVRTVVVDLEATQGGRVIVRGTAQCVLRQ